MLVASTDLETNFYGPGTTSYLLLKISKRKQRLLDSGSSMLIYLYKAHNERLKKFRYVLEKMKKKNLYKINPLPAEPQKFDSVNSALKVSPHMRSATLKCQIKIIQLSNTLKQTWEGI